LAKVTLSNHASKVNRMGVLFSLTTILPGRVPTAGMKSSRPAAGRPPRPECTIITYYSTPLHQQVVGMLTASAGQGTHLAGRTSPYSASRRCVIGDDSQPA
jgi:hypothetical protein